LVLLFAVFGAAAGRKKLKQSKILMLMWLKCILKKENKQMHLQILNCKIIVIWKDQEQTWEYKRQQRISVKKKLNQLTSIHLKYKQWTQTNNCIKDPLILNEKA
jgi:hypothetical protein